MTGPIPTWEYRIEHDLSESALAALGADGWELIESGGRRYVFKRPALTFVERVTLEQRASYYASLELDAENGR